MNELANKTNQSNGRVIEESKKILLVSHEMSVTGAPNSLLRQAKYFRAAGYAVEVWTLAGGDLTPRYVEAGFTPVLVENDRQAIRARYEANPVPYALVVCNTIRTYRAVDVLRRYPLKVAWFVRETLLLDEDMWLNPDFASVFASFHNLYTVSEYAAQIVRDYNPAVRVIHNSVADVFAAYAKPARATRFGFIGSMIHAKGADLLIEAFRTVLHRYPDCTLTMAGGSARDDFAAYRARTADEPAIRWLGQVQSDSKRAFFDGIDVLCVPSLDEPSGLTVIEGAMYGKAIITTDHTGANYLVDEACGRIVPANDGSALADALASFAAMDASARASFGRHARERYCALGTNAVEAAAVLKMIDECRPEPMSPRPLPDDHAVPWFHESHLADGRKRWYFRNMRLITLKGKGIRRR